MVVRKIAAGALLMFALGGCAASPAAAPATTSASPAPLSAAWYKTGAAVAASVAPVQVAPGGYHPVAVASTGAYLAVSPAATPVTKIPTPSAVCPPALGPASSIPVTATAGTGVISAHWTDLGDPSVLMYRLAAVPDSGAPTKWLTVAATHTCKPLTSAITGLTKGTNYEVWLDAVHTVTTYGVSGTTQETMIGRSLAVTVL